MSEKAILQQVDAQKEITPSRSLKKIRPGEDVVHNADLPDHPGLVNRMWHSMVDPIWHSKKPEPDEKSITGNDAEEKPDEKQFDVEVEVDEDPQASEVKLDLDALMQLAPEAFHVQPEAKEIETVIAVPDENEIASKPEAVLDPIREAVEVSPFTQTVASRLETEAAGTRKIRRRHDKRRTHSDESHLVSPHHFAEQPEKPEEPVRPGLLRRAVVGIGSTAWSAGKSVLSSVGSVVGLGRNRTPISIPEEPAAKTDKKYRD